MRYISMCALCVLLWGCASPKSVGQSIRNSVPQATRAGSSWLSAEATSGAPLLYADSGTCACVLIFRRDTGALVGLLGGPNGPLAGPTGLATDSAGNLFVGDVDSNDNYQVWVYPAGQLVPSRELYDANLPIDVAVATDGTVYVSDSTYPSIMVYAHQSNAPTSELLDIRAMTGEGLALDRRGNVYWGIQTSSGYRIDKFQKGSTKPVDLGIALPDAPFELAFDRGGDLVVSQPDVPAIDIFELPNTLSAQIVTTGCPSGIALTTSVQRIYVADQCGSPLTAYTYPGGRPAKTFDVGGYFQPANVAVYPQ